MRHIVSVQGGAEKTKSLPVNGTYTIDEVRKANSDERWF
jgi:hypothetical protein